MDARPLSRFHPATARWFRESFAEPTPAQTRGWPEIASGRNSLILAPTGSGKTLAAFLYAIDELISRPVKRQEVRGVHTLYLSPLKALANDIERNLEPALAGIVAAAEGLEMTLPEIRVGRRTGDTTPAERRQMVRRPPDLLVTTPESLHLLLTSVKAREMLRTVRYVIVDEIHAVCPNKRGSFLALLLERLDALTTGSPVRIGLSATQRPLQEVARFLGGYRKDGSPRPVAIVDAGRRRRMDLKVIATVEDMKRLPAGEGRGPSIWPSIYERLLELIETHRSTLIFANSRRVVERLAVEINRLAGDDLVRAHHGSVSKGERRRIEEELKAGRLPALVATASMELGIDIGAVDLVCQVEAPFSVASGLQRVGRAGHLIRATSVGRMLPKTRADLLVMAGMSRAMVQGEISAVRYPRCPLDLLAQQIVAMVAMDAWTADELYARIRQAAPYRQLTREAYGATLELLAGRYRTPALPALRPRISWERSTGRLSSLPGSRHAALLNGGAIPDSGQYAMVLEDGATRIGELDEEFVFERRLGDTFLLGTGCWRILEIRHDRVVVAPAELREGIMPFWKGEGLGRDAEFGRWLGEFVRACEARLEAGDAVEWLVTEASLDPAAAGNLVVYLEDQRAAGPIPNDRRILVDLFRNEAGDPRIAVLSTYGRSFHLALLLGLQSRLRRDGYPVPDAITSGDGILLRPGGIPVDAVIGAMRSLRADRFVGDVIGEVEGTSYFAMRFRRNAGRALLLPRARPGRRTPLWLQRLRAHDLLAVAADQSTFPIVTETFREIVEDELPLEAVGRFLEEVERGGAEFAVRRDRRPSPFAASLLLDFTGKYLYEEDRPVVPVRRSRSPTSLAEPLGPRRDAEAVFDDEAIRTMEERLQGTAAVQRARDGTELVELVRRVGDLTEAELPSRCEAAALAAVPALFEDGRLVTISIPGSPFPDRWVTADDAAQYRRMDEEDLRDIVRRYVASHAMVKRRDVAERYPAAASRFEAWAASEGWIEILDEHGAVGWCDPAVAIGIRRLTLSARRRRIVPASLEAYGRTLVEAHGCGRLRPADELPDVIDQLAGCAVPLAVWDDVLSVRIEEYDRRMLDRLVAEGAVAWRGRTVGRSRRLVLATAGSQLLGPEPPGVADEEARRVAEFLAEQGASFLHQIAAGLGRPTSEMAAVLWQLTWSGHVTNDALSVAWGGPPRPERWSRRRRSNAWGGGRWSLVSDQGGERRSDEATRTALAVLLRRAGVITRETLIDNAFGIPWGEAYPLLSRMEWAGEVERGLFVSGLSGPQFGTAAAIDGLRNPDPVAGPILLNVLDPACAYGNVVPVVLPDGGRYVVRRHPANYLVLQEGRPVIAVERRGERLVPLEEMTGEERRRAMSLLPQLVAQRSGPTAIRVRTWAGRPILDAPVARELERVGFVRDDREMIRYRQYEERRAP